ncbi:aldo/keto reductase family protein [Ceratobasidium sp. AG-Ba]|nr:aldo/keto reductase family protein [Ceratobasidium sp. AG-Ba]
MTTPTFPMAKSATRRVSAIGFGSMVESMIGYQSSRSDFSAPYRALAEWRTARLETMRTRFKVLDKLVELGCTNWDTADHYGDAEELIGNGSRGQGSAIKGRENTHIGLSVPSPTTLRRAHKCIRLPQSKLSIPPFVLDIEAKGHLLDTARELGIAVVAYTPTGTTCHADLPERDFPKFKEVGSTHNATGSQVALAFLLAQGDSIVPIPGSRTIEHQRRKHARGIIKLTPEEVASLRKAIEDGDTWRSVPARPTIPHRKLYTRAEEGARLGDACIENVSRASMRVLEPPLVGDGLLALEVPTLLKPATLFSLPTSLRDPSCFAHLRVASLDFGRAFEYSNSTWRPLVPNISLPPSLRELEILWFHASEENTIALVGRLCPNITALRLVFCTMFNRPRCIWWAGHQHSADHEHYLKGCGLAEVEIYARTVALALGALPNLKSIHLGVYFIPPRAINNHRTLPSHARYHPHRDSNRWLNHSPAQNATQFAAMWNAQHPGFPSPNIHLPCLADKKIWEASCPRCFRVWTDRVERAERLAATILAVELCSLKSVSFGSFVAERRTSPSEWMVCRSAGEDRVWVRAQRSGVDCRSVVPILFQRSGAKWVQVERPM